MRELKGVQYRVDAPELLAERERAGGAVQLDGHDRDPAGELTLAQRHRSFEPTTRERHRRRGDERPDHQRHRQLCGLEQPLCECDWQQRDRREPAGSEPAAHPGGRDEQDEPRQRPGEPRRRLHRRRGERRERPAHL